MKVLIINHSDALGGAAIASMRLLDGLKAVGAEARLLVTDARTGRPEVDVAGTGWQRRLAFVAERAGVLWNNGFKRSTLWLIDPASHGVNIAAHPWVQWADAIVLGWINQGTLSLDGLQALLAIGKPVVWVLHDQWPMTGICHLPDGCQGWTMGCERCPLLPPAKWRLAAEVHRRKADLYRAPNLRFVAVSNWMAACAGMSSLLRGKTVKVIPNPLDCAAYSTRRLHDAMYGDHDNKVVLTMGAARLDDPVKGLPLLVEASRLIAERSPQLASRLHIIFYGGLRNDSALDAVALDHTFVGYVDDPREVYARADVVLSTSRVESFGYTLSEGMASGCVAVTTGGGGQRDIVTHLKDGFVAESTPQSLAEGIGWAADCRLDRNAQHRSVASRFDHRLVAKQWLQFLDPQVLPPEPPPPPPSGGGT